MKDMYPRKVDSALGMDIQSGDILFFEADVWYRDPFVQLIKWVTRSPIVHCGIACWVHRELFVLESQYGRDRTLTHIDTYFGRKVIVVKPPYNWDSISAIWLSTVSHVPYGYMDLLAVGVVNIFKDIGIKITLPNYKGEICSEFVAKVCNISPSNISPAQLFQILKKPD